MPVPSREQKVTKHILHLRVGDAQTILFMKGRGFRPVGGTGLLSAEMCQFVFYSEFFFLKAYNNFLIWMGAGDFVFDCLFELGMTVLKVIDQIHSSHTVLLKASPKQ